MELNFKFVSLILIFVHNGYAMKCSANSIYDSQCSTYCYQIVKPLLQHAAEAYQKHTDYSILEKKLSEQKTIVHDLKIELAKLKGFENELTIYKSNNVTQNDLLVSYKAEIDKLSAENLKIKESINTLRNDAATKYNAIHGTDRPSCLKQRSGISKMEVNSIHKFEVPCDSDLLKDSAGWTVIQRRKDATVSFDQNWIKYRTGFGDLNGSFFLGLEKIHLLTNERPHELYIFLKTENETRYAHYDHFQIADDNESFKINSLGKYSGTAGDALVEHIGMKFSTFDSDNDISKYNCATEWLSGWWYKNCSYCNLNGLYRDDLHNYQNGIKWNTWDQYIRFTFVQMMIRPVK